jgi:hypothetical protein
MPTISSFGLSCRGSLVAPLLPGAALQPVVAEQDGASRKGTIAIAIAAPSPSAPPEMARWNDSVAIRWVAFSGPPRVST